MSYYRDGYGSSSRGSYAGIIIGSIIGLLVVGVAIWILIWANVGWARLGSLMLNNMWYAWVMPAGDITQLTPFGWMLVIGIIASVLGVVISRVSGYSPSWLGWATGLALVGLLIWGVFGMTLHGVRTAEYTYGAHPEGETSTEFVVVDKNEVPGPLARVDSDSNPLVPIVAEQDTTPLPEEYTSRPADRENAETRLTSSGSGSTNTELEKDTVQLMYGHDGDPVWTAIRDGKKREYLYGVASWNTTETPTTCRFEGDYELRRHFGAYFGESLFNDIASWDKNFLFDKGDIWGYCDGDEPVIVVPGARADAYKHQTVISTYRVLTITGSPTGMPRFEAFDNVKSGQFPGPVYPLKLVTKQIDRLDDTTGFTWGTYNVGYTPLADPIIVQSDNRLYWFTKMRPASSDTDVAMAYSLIAADEFTGGKMNMQRVYALAEGDGRMSDTSAMRDSAGPAANKLENGFFSVGGSKLGSATPISLTKEGGTWQMIASTGGQPRMYITSEGSITFRATAVELDPNTGQPITGSSPGDDSDPELDCNDLSGLSKLDLASCISSLVNELATREDAATE